MFDLLRPLTKLAMIAAFIAFFVAANAALLYVLSSCAQDAACIGTSGAAGVVTAIRTWAGVFLPGNFFACVQFMILGEIMRRAYDFSVKVMDVTAKAS